MRIPGISGRKHLRLMGVTAVVIVVAAAGGYVGLAGAHARPSPTDGQSGRLHGAAASPQAAAAARASGVDSGASGSAVTGGIACPMIPATAPTGTDAGIGSATHVFTRTTADGVTIRTYRLPDTGLCGCGPLPAVSSGPPSSGSSSSGSASAVDVINEGALSIELSDDTAVGVGTLFDPFGPTATTADAGTETVNPVSGAFGVTEGDPVWWTAVSVGSDVANVQMTFADGSTDQMAPVDGVVVLAHHIDTGVASSGQGPDVVRGTLRLLDSSGALLSAVPVPEPVSPPAFPPTTAPGSPPMSAQGSATRTLVPTPSPPPVTNATAAICADAVAASPSPSTSPTVVAPSIAP